MNSSTSDLLPAELGFRWVAEWEPHEATWIAWPHNRSTWPNRFEPIPKIFEKKVRLLAEVEQVHVLGGTQEAMLECQRLFKGCSQISLHDIETNDCWIRDTGPTFLTHRQTNQLAAIQWRFNAWGNKYPHDRDSNVASSIAKSLDCQRFSSQLTCEGGGLETDGQGTLLTTSSCLLSQSRNPGWSRLQIEDVLCSMLAVEKVLWVDGGQLAGDDTDSHIDQLVRFVRPGVVVSAVAYSPDDSNCQPLQRQAARLTEMKDARGRTLEIIPLVTPPQRYIQGERVPESYCNFYLANQIVLVPQFGFRETDDAALRMLGQCFPDRTMVALDASDLIWGRGAFHCATQQQPKAVAKS